MIDLDFAAAAVIAISIAMAYSSLQYFEADKASTMISDLKTGMQLLEKSNELLETCEFVQCDAKLVKSHELLEPANFSKGRCISRLGLHDGVETVVQACV